MQRGSAFVSSQGLYSTALRAWGGREGHLTVWGAARSSVVGQVELEERAEQQTGRVSGTALEGTADGGRVEGHG